MGFGDYFGPIDLIVPGYSAAGTTFGGDDERKQGLEEALTRQDARLQPTLDQLQARARGEQSVTEEQLRQALGRNIAGQSAIQASARPGQQGMAARLAAQQTGKMGSEISGQAALARLQEQEMANRLLGQMLLGMRGQDVQGQLGLMQQPTFGERLLGAGAGIAQAKLSGGG
jgi:hypothetical protein